MFFVQNKFSSKSDIWSFGVTLWEILTFAREQPFSELSNRQILQQCSRLHTNSSEPTVLLKLPLNYPTEIYDLMVACWNRDEMQRPSFHDVHMFLQRQNAGYNPDIDVHPYVDYRCKDSLSQALNSQLVTN